MTSVDGDERVDEQKDERQYKCTSNHRYNESEDTLLAKATDKSYSETRRRRVGEEELSVEEVEEEEEKFNRSRGRRKFNLMCCKIKIGWTDMRERFI